MSKMDAINLENITSQEVLHQVEALCTAEEPAACASACPLHIDGREICRLISSGDTLGAFKLYQKQAPFALILAYTCPAPCEKACLRKDFGGALSMSELEKMLAKTEGKPEKAPLFIPKKGKKVAIIGGSLKGLSAAHYLAKKGYPVTLFEKTGTLGGMLLKSVPTELPLEVFESEKKILTSLKVKLELNTEITNVQSLREDFDGVYVATTALTLAESEDKLVIDTNEDANLPPGSVYEIFAGRRAGTTLDRLFQGVNITAGREREGSYETTLFTNLENVTEKPQVVPEADTGYTKAEGIQEASRCLQCKCEMCVDKCGFLQEYGKNPRQYVREVYNNLAIAMGTHHANKMINTCALCQQCEAICPNGLDMGKVFLAAREKMVATRKMPPSAFEFGLLDMDYSMSGNHFMAKHQPGFSTSKYLFFPGCQLTASEPDLVKRTYQDLQKQLPWGVGLMLSCCGVLAKWAGEREQFARVKEQITLAWEDLGKPLVITACPTCQQTLKAEMGIPAKSLFEVIKAWHQGAQSSRQMVLHHACGSRYDEETKAVVSELASHLGIDFTKRTDLSAESPCCGYGGLVPVVDEEVAGKITKVALKQLSEDDKLPILTYCVNCRDRFLMQGQEAYHLLEVFYDGSAKTRHEPPTYSERQDNRRRLKIELLRELWEEEVEEQIEMELIINQELADKLEKTHILESDIRQVIGHAEATKERLIDPESGHYTAYYRLGNVTFWVEYLPQGTGYQVFNSYSHRMEFVLDDTLTKGRS